MFHLLGQFRVRANTATARTNNFVCMYIRQAILRVHLYPILESLYLSYSDISQLATRLGSDPSLDMVGTLLERTLQMEENVPEIHADSYCLTSQMHFFIKRLGKACGNSQPVSSRVPSRKMLNLKFGRATLSACVVWKRVYV